MSTDPLAFPFNPYLIMRSGYELAHSDVRVNWLIRDIWVQGAVNGLVGSAGTGKSTLLLDQAGCVSRGVPWHGLETICQPVYIIDHENPESRLCEDARDRDLTRVIFWNQGCEIPPPKVDSPYFDSLKLLQPGLIVIDGHRASMFGDENSSQDTALAIEKWRELTRLGFTVVLIHHTKKDDPRVFRGSQAFIDQVDHPLFLYAVAEAGSIEPANADDYNDCLLFLGTGLKTRFSSVRQYLRRAGHGQFTIEIDPDIAALNGMARMLTDRPLNTSEFEMNARNILHIGRNEARALMARGLNDGLWQTIRGNYNSTLYSLLSVPPAAVRHPTGGGEPDNGTGSGSPGGFTENERRTLENTGLAGTPPPSGEVANPTGIVSLLPSDSTGVMP